MNKIIRRVLAVIPAVLLQLLWLMVLFRWLAPYAAIINLVLTFYAFIYVLYIITNRNEGTYKTLWLLVILTFPLPGTVLYWCFGNKKTAKPIQKKLEKTKTDLPQLKETEASDAMKELKQDIRAAQTFEYLHKKTKLSMFPCERAEYFPVGEDMFARMLPELEKAERFIFVEYFIIQNGMMWDSMVEIMERKAKQGVDVRVMYDDLGSISTYSKQNVKRLHEKGIKCLAFNPMVFIKGTLNYRDHRKMLIIDGKVAFSGGVNLADEYINKVKKFGHWKDIGFCITGAPVYNYTYMFAEFWNAFSGNTIPSEYLMKAPADRQEVSNGYVLSYYDSPLHQDAVSNNLYVELLSQSTEYAWFYTPYLMLGDYLLDAFVRAAQRGVDVRIIMPGIPDKKLVFRMSRSYYQTLLEAGVKIYEYMPGFVHAKGCVVDGKFGTIGTVNLDYRSLFLHFENNSLFYQCSILNELEKDFMNTQEKCQEKTLNNIGINFRKWMLDGLLRIFAPLC